MEEGHNRSPPFVDLPSFTISSHELYEVASKLIQSDEDKRFLERIFGEIQKIHKEEEKEEEGMEDKVRGGLGEGLGEGRGEGGGRGCRGGAH